MAESYCARAAALEDRIWEGTIEGFANEELTIHTAACADCGAVVAGISRAKSAIAEYGDEEVIAPNVEEAWSRVAERLDEKARSRQWGIWSVASGMAAAAVVIVGVVSWYGIDGSMKQSAAPAAANSAIEMRFEDNTIASAPRSPARIRSMGGAKEATEVSDAARTSAAVYDNVPPVYNSVSSEKLDRDALLPAAPRVERSASLTLNIPNARDGFKRISGMVAEAGGSILASNVAQSAAKTPARATLTARIPVAKFDGFIAGLHELGEIAAENIVGTDRTESYRDMEAAIRDKDVVLHRLRDRLATPGVAVDEVKRVESEIDRVRSERDQLESSRRSAAAKTDYATIEIALDEKTSSSGGLVPFESFSRNFSSSFGTAMEFFSLGVTVILIVSGAILPWAMIGAPVVYIWRRKRFAW